MIEKWKRLKAQVEKVEFLVNGLQESIKYLGTRIDVNAEQSGGNSSRMDYIEDEMSKCIAPRLAKSTHNDLQWCISHISRLDKLTPELMEDIKHMQFIYDQFEECSKDITHTRVFLKTQKFKKVNKQMVELNQKLLDILLSFGKMSESIANNEEVIKYLQEKTPEAAMIIVNAKDQILAGNPDLNGDNIITDYERTAYDIGKPILDEAIERAKKRTGESAPVIISKWNRAIDLSFKIMQILGGLGWVIFLISQVVNSPY